MEKIKPCPFCGYDDPFFDESMDSVLLGEKAGLFLSCPSCEARGPVCRDAQHAAELWNQRI